MPSEAVSLTKQNRMVKTALYYMQKNKLLDYMCRFDVLEIIVDEDNSKRINLIKDAFQYSGKYGY
jgi:putative endonuclease